MSLTDVVEIGIGIYLVGLLHGAIAVTFYFQSKLNERDAKRSGK